MERHRLCVKKMLDELARLSETERSREIDAELAEFRARVERGEVPPPPPWKPDFPDPFGGKWEFFTPAHA